MKFDVAQARAQFPALNSKLDIFFDGPGGAQVPLSVAQAVASYLTQTNANLGGFFDSSLKTNALLSRARECAQAVVNAPTADNIVFDQNMTSLAFKLSRTISKDWSSDDEVIVTRLDHYSNVSSWQLAAQDKAATIHQVNVDLSNCDLDYTHLESLISSKTKLLALTYASNTTGTIVNLKRVIELAKSVGAIVFVDAVHMAPHGILDVQELGCDFLCISAYKFCGPHLGIAYIATKWLDKLQPYKVDPAPSLGPARFETGTQSFEAMAGFVATVDYLSQWAECKKDLRESWVESMSQVLDYEQSLGSYCLEQLRSIKGLTLYGHSSQGESTPTFALTIDGHSPEYVAKVLSEHRICVWHGHFYAKGLIEQLGLAQQGGLLRIGLMHYNTHQEIDKLIAVLRDL